MVIANLHKNYSKLMLAGSGEFSHTEKRRENIALSKGSQDFAVGALCPTLIRGVQSTDFSRAFLSKKEPN
jgi:hypothetical protein